MNDTADTRRALSGALAVYLFLLPLVLYPGSVRLSGEIKWLLTSAVGWALGVYVLWTSRRTGLRSLRFGHCGAALSAFALLTAAASFFSANSMLSVVSSAPWLSLPFLYLAAANAFRSSRETTPVLTAVALSGVVVSAFAVFGTNGGGFGAANFFGEAGLAVPLALAVYLALADGRIVFALLAILPAVGLYQYPAPKGMLFLGCAVAAALAAALLRFFRSRLARKFHRLSAATADLAALTALRPRRRPQRMSIRPRPATTPKYCHYNRLHRLATKPGEISGLGRADLVLGALVLLAGAGWGAWSLVSTDGFGDDTNLGRKAALSTVGAMTLERPLTGFGMGTLPIEHPRFWTTFEQVWYGQTNRAIEETGVAALDVAYGAGGFALAALAAFFGFAFFSSLRRGLTDSRRDSGELNVLFAGIFFGFFVLGVVGRGIFDPFAAGLLAVIAGVGDGLASTRDRQPTEVRPRYAYAAAFCTAAIALLSLFWSSRAVQNSLLLDRVARAEGSGESSDVLRTLLGRSTRIAPWDWRAHRKLGRIALTERDYVSANRHFDAALARNPNDLPSRAGKLELAVRGFAGKHLQGNADPFDGGGPGELQTAFQRDAYLQAEAEIAQALDVEASLCVGCGDVYQVGALFHTFSAQALGRRSGEGEQDRQVVLARWRKAAGSAITALARNASDPVSVTRLLVQALEKSGEIDFAFDYARDGVERWPFETHDWAAFYDLAFRTHRFDEFQSVVERSVEVQLSSGMPNAEQVTDRSMWLARLATEHSPLAANAYVPFQRAVSYGPFRHDVWYSYFYFSLPYSSSRFDRFKVRLTTTNRVLQEEGHTPIPAIEALAAVFEGGERGLAEGIGVVGELRDELHETGAHDRAIEERLQWPSEVIRETLRRRPEFATRHPEATADFSATCVKLGWTLYSAQLLELGSDELDWERRENLILWWTAQVARYRDVERALVPLEAFAEQFPESQRLAEALELLSSNGAAAYVERYGE